MAERRTYIEHPRAEIGVQKYRLTCGTMMTIERTHPENEMITLDRDVVMVLQIGESTWITEFKAGVAKAVHVGPARSIRMAEVPDGLQSTAQMLLDRSAIDARYDVSSQ